jgi:hypothetical protein
VPQSVEGLQLSLFSFLCSENIHLTTYTTEADFYARCYPRYLSLLTKAGEFLNATGGTDEKAIVFIRCVD